jgi:hypothetical protein
MSNHLKPTDVDASATTAFDEFVGATVAGGRLTAPDRLHCWIYGNETYGGETTPSVESLRQVLPFVWKVIEFPILAVPTLWVPKTRRVC